MKEQIDIFDDLLIEFDEMGFVPTTAVPDHEAYAIDWKNRLINALEGYRKSEWISVEDRLPEDTGTYLTWHRAGYYGQHEYNAKLHGWNVIWCDDRSTEIKTVTHWMPLPEPPEMKVGGE